MSNEQFEKIIDRLDQLVDVMQDIRRIDEEALRELNFNDSDWSDGEEKNATWVI